MIHLRNTLGKVTSVEVGTDKWLLKIEKLLNAFAISRCLFSMPELSIVSKYTMNPKNVIDIKYKLNKTGRKSTRGKITVKLLTPSFHTESDYGNLVTIKTSCVLRYRGAIYDGVLKKLLYQYCCSLLLKIDAYAGMVEEKSLILPETMYELRATSRVRE